MKFKREDLGLYFALGLVGAGAGLLVGVFISQKLAGPEPIYIPDTEHDEPDIITPAGYHKVKTDPKKSRKKKSEKKTDNKELIDFIDEYQPTTIELAMLDKGMTSMDELKVAIEARTGVTDASPTNYHGVYLEDEEDKPDLEELVELPDEVEVVDDRWKISITMSSDKSRKNLREIHWDREHDQFLSKARSGKDVQMHGLENTISNEAWDVVAPFLLSGIGPVFVNDLLSPKHYVFTTVSEDAEVSSADGSSAVS